MSYIYNVMYAFISIAVTASHIYVFSRVGICQSPAPPSPPSLSTHYRTIVVRVVLLVHFYGCCIDKCVIVHNKGMCTLHRIRLSA